MRLLIDQPEIERFDFLRPEIVHGEVRRYYCTKRNDERLALVVVRDDRELTNVAGRVMDVSIGNDRGYSGYVHITSRIHTKITIYGACIGDDYEDTLSNVLAHAPLRSTEPTRNSF